MQNYKFESDTKTFFSLTNRGKNPNAVQLKAMSLQHKISTEKKRDVRKLLEKEFGENWQQNPRLGFYNEIIKEGEFEKDDDDTGANTTSNLGFICDCLE